MPGLRDLKRRIRGIQNMRKVTRAMQLVSAAKMRKAQDSVVSSRGYAGLAWELINNVSAAVQEKDDEMVTSPLLKTYPNAKKVGVILLSTNRGLVGSLNTNLQPVIKNITSPNPSFKEEGDTESPLLAKEGQGEVIADMIVYGKYAKKIAVRLNKNVIGDFNKSEKKITSEDIYPLAEFVTQAWQTGQYKEIVIVYNHFVSTLTQKPSVRQLLPFNMQASQLISKSADQQTAPTDYLLEPNPQTVLDHLLPRIIESQIYQTILESDASEHSARMVMMKNATEAAGDLIADYTLTYNQLRQNKITTELAEITAGKIALE